MDIKRELLERKFLYIKSRVIKPKKICFVKKRQQKLNDYILTITLLY